MVKNVEPVLLLALLLIGVFAGAFGAIFGLGGGIILIPVMTIVFGLGATEAAAASLIGIVATSAGAASRSLRKGTANIRLGLLLEITTSIGAILGAAVAVYLADWILFVFFAAVMLYSGIKMALSPERAADAETEDGPMTFEYTEASEGDAVKRYTVRNVRSGLGLCVAAGMISSMTGVGGGSIKVPLMNIHMHIPLKVASATSSYMIGITAFSGAVIYLAAGQVLLDVAAAVAIGTYTGALVGARLAEKMHASALRKYISVVFFFVCAVMILKAGGYM
jgi:hypothetical protein